VLVTWAALSALAVCVGGRFFGHYFLQLELPLALAAAPVLQAMWARTPRRLVAAWALPAGFFFCVAVLPSVSRRILNPHDPDYQRIGAAVRARVGPDDTIWVWGNVPQIYFAADRRPGTRFSFCNYLTGLSPATPSEEDPLEGSDAAIARGAWPLASHDLAERRPLLIVDTAAAGYKSYAKYPMERYPLLARALAEHYRRDG
jgi:hypothetical protein